ncbi:cytochrome C biogenesis protein [Lysobacter sp. TY2-98]|uniref:tetratricopeptide repeat protein n=1 Tax=Lysobacter sp. TY2-98 TaxID=2290922 RepID=UPI000E20B4A5|nr:tetratricopeptide repeat protein [Lysobacter sp. TY2-98]AXK71735.1 cytochrome C biogenesis protein [Lysobacter sp. TY2-98]
MIPNSFIAAALALGLAVLVLAFGPLIRRRPAVGGVVAGAALVAVSAMYLLVGTPAALDPAKLKPVDTLASAVERLEAELARKPAQADGWRLLADAYRAEGRPADVARVYGQALRYAPDDPDLLAQAAEARAIAAPGRRFDDEAIAMLHHALEIQPAHQRSRWFLGVAQRQAGKAADAATTWESLLANVDPATASALRTQIDDARRDAGLPPLPDSALPKTRALTVRVDIAPGLRPGLPKDAAVFVIAREPGGMPMPVAAKRIALSDLPATVALTDADSPMPTRRLSQLPQVEVIARVSRTGIANAQAGDLESSAVKVASDAKTELTIDHTR